MQTTYQTGQAGYRPAGAGIVVRRGWILVGCLALSLGMWVGLFRLAGALF